MKDVQPVIIKVGGSLYDLPDLGRRLHDLLRQPEMRPALLVPGGGGFVHAVRHFDRLHSLGEEASHWLALDAMTLAGRALQRLLPGSLLVAGPEENPDQGIRILDARRFAEADEGRPGALPHTWQVTSDSIAARVAEVSRARRLVLLKSIALPEPVDWQQASERGFVDEYFPQAIAGCQELSIVAINLRDS